MADAERLAAAVTGIVRPKVTMERIKVLAFETRTGRVAATVPYVGQPVWSLGVNTAGGWRVQVPVAPDIPAGTSSAGIDHLKKDYKEWLDGIADPWRFSWAICQGSKIWQAGPMIAEEYTEGSPTTSIVGAGFWQLLTDKRRLINPARATLAGIASADADVAFGPGTVSTIGSVIPAAHQNLSLHTIAKRIVQIITTAAGGNLPVVYPADIAGTSERTYPGYDLASPGQRLAELTQVIDGPEIEFRPQFVDEVTKQQIQWEMRIGNSRLGNLGFPHAFDYGKALVGINRSTNGSGRATRDWERGNGMNRDLVTGFYDQPLGPDAAAMLLENAGQDHTSSSNVSELNGWAQSYVLSNVVTAPNYSATVRVAGDNGQGEQTRSPILTTVDAGDNCVAEVRRHPRLPDGRYKFRIVGMASSGRAEEAVLQLHFLGRSA